MKNTLLIYGAGDKGTQGLLGKLFEMGVSCELRDIRCNFNVDLKDDHNKDNLKFLLEHNLTTVPQVFHKDMTYIGNYEDAVAYAERIPLDQRHPPEDVDPPKSYA